MGKKGKESELVGSALTSAGSLERGPAGSGVTLNLGKVPPGHKGLLQAL